MSQMFKNRDTKEWELITDETELSILTDMSADRLPWNALATHREVAGNKAEASLGAGASFYYEGVTYTNTGTSIRAQKDPIDAPSEEERAALHAEQVRIAESGLLGSEDYAKAMARIQQLEEQVEDILEALDDGE